MRRGWLAAAVGAAALVAPGTALAGFSSTVLEVSGDFPNDVFPATAASESGESVVIWIEAGSGSSVLRARRVQPNGTMTAPVLVSDGSQLIVQRAVAYAPDGRALVIWTESANGAPPRSLRGRWMAADGTFGPQIPIRDAVAGTAAVDEPALATTTDGDAVVAWRNPLSTPAGKVEARRVDANGTLGTLLQPPDGPNVGSGVEVARAPGGGALLAWRAPPGIASMPVDAAGAAGTVRTPVADGVLGAPVMAGSGSAFRMIWPSTMPASEAVIGLDATGQASTAQQAIDGAASVSSTALSVGPAGRALALWGRNGGSVAARFVAPDGTPEAATISAPAAGQAQFATDADLLADGTGVLLWTQGPSGQARGLMSRVVRPDGSLEDTATLAPVADQAEFAAAPSGVGLVVWQDRATAGGPPRARARQFLPAPACPDATATSVQGRETTVVLACQGLQLQTPEVLTTPAGGTLGLVDGPAGRVTYTPRPGFEGVDSFTFRGRNPGGSGAAATARITVGRDTVVPRVTAMRLSVSRVRLRTSFRRPPARRPALVLRLSEPATITVNLQRKRRGVFRSFRTLRSPGPVTRATFRLPKKGLVPGAYRANVVVTDLAGNRSAPRRAGFVVVRG